MSSRTVSPSPTRAAQEGHQQPSFLGTMLLVATREVRARLRSKAFLAMSGIMLALVAGATVVPNILGGDDPMPVAVVGQAPDGVAELTDPDGTAYFDVVESDVSLAEAKDLLREEEVDAALVFDEGGPVVWGLDSTPTRAVEALSAAPRVELVDPDAPDEGQLYLISVVFALTFFMAAMTFGTQIAQSVVEEKQTRIVEILLSAISARALMAGKILGNATLAFGQILAVALVAVVGLASTGQRIGLGELGPAIGWFLPFFAIGFLMLSAMFAASAALVSRAEDIGSVTTPVTMLVMIPYFLIFIVNSNETWMRVLSWVPFSAPIAMPVRVFTEQAQWWEPVGSLAVLALTTVLTVHLAERIYTNSLLRTGSRVPLRQALNSDS